MSSLKALFSEYQVEPRKEHEQAVTAVAEHYSEQEWKCDDSIWCCKSEQIEMKIDFRLRANTGFGTHGFLILPSHSFIRR